MPTSYDHPQTADPESITVDQVSYARPAHDAVVAQIRDYRDDDPLVLNGLYVALWAVDALRYAVAPSTLAGVRARGFTVEDTWTGESLQWFAGRGDAQRLADEQNELNADESGATVAHQLRGAS